MDLQGESMAIESTGTQGKLNVARIFQFLKYFLYILLASNIYSFYLQDSLASVQTFPQGVALGDVIEAYSASIDTVSWVILLLMFELETYVLEDHQIRGVTKVMLSSTKILCYTIISYSFYGYLTKYAVVANTQILLVDNVCDLIVSGFSYVKSMDEYPLLAAESCMSFGGKEVHQIIGTKIIATQDALLGAQRLALVDVVNSASWLAIVAMLEVEVFLQLRGRLTDKVMGVSKYFKVLFYLNLLLAAIYWGIWGKFIDFWDAFLWIVAFVFIEMNIFEWNAETKEQEAEQA